MRFVIIDAVYDQYLDWLYSDACPGLEDRSFREQRDVYYATLFAGSDFYSHALRSLGHEVDEYICNCVPMQAAWLRENGAAAGEEAAGAPPPASAPQGHRWRMKTILRGKRALVLAQIVRARAGRTPLRMLRPLLEPLLRKLDEFDTGQFAILLEQVRRARPDVLYLQSIFMFSDERLAELKRHAGLLIGEHAAMPLPERIDYRAFDLVVSSFPPTVDWLRARGVRAELQPLGFDPRVNDAIPVVPRDVPVSFVGSLFSVHSSRLELLEEVAARLPLQVYGNITIPLSPGSPLRDRIGPPLWGRDMFSLMRRSQVVINHHGDVLPYANNMRLYEATGMGALLVTDYKDNLGELFEPGKEVVTYRDAGECIDRIRFYLDDRNAAARQAIMTEGQVRTLTDHTTRARLSRLVSML